MTTHLDPDRLLASEALIAFVAWLTTRAEVTTMSAAHDSAGPANLVRDFIDVNELREPRPEWIGIPVRQPEYPEQERRAVSEADMPQGAPAAVRELRKIPQRTDRTVVDLRGEDGPSEG